MVKNKKVIITKEMIFMRENGNVEKLELGLGSYIFIYRLNGKIYFECYDKNGNMFRNIDISNDTKNIEKRIYNSIKMIKFGSRFFK